MSKSSSNSVDWHSTPMSRSFLRHAFSNCLCRTLTTAGRCASSSNGEDIASTSSSHRSATSGGSSSNEKWTGTSWLGSSTIHSQVTTVSSVVFGGQLTEYLPSFQSKLAVPLIFQSIRGSHSEALNVSADEPPPRAVRRQREIGDLGTHPPGHSGHEWVIAIEHDPAIGFRDPADRGLDLGELRQGVDALQVEMVGGDVGEDARVVRFVAHPAQDDAATGGLQHGYIEIGPSQHLLCAARSGPVAGFHQALTDEHPVRGRRPDAPPGQYQDMADQPGDGRFAVGPRDGDRRHAPVRVADPGGR